MLGEEGCLFVLGLEAGWHSKHAFDGLRPHAVPCPPLGGFWSNRARYGLATPVSQEASAFAANGLHRDRGSFGLVTILSARRSEPTREPDTNRAPDRAGCHRRPYGGRPEAGPASELAGLGVVMAPPRHRHASDDRRNCISRLVNSRTWSCRRTSAWGCPGAN